MHQSSMKSMCPDTSRFSSICIKLVKTNLALVYGISPDTLHQSSHKKFSIKSMVSLSLFRLGQVIHNAHFITRDRSKTALPVVVFRLIGLLRPRYCPQE